MLPEVLATFPEGRFVDRVIILCDNRTLRIKPDSSVSAPSLPSRGRSHGSNEEA